MAAHLTPRDVAQQWQCHPDTVTKLCRRGLLRALRIGTAWRITPEAVAEYEARHTSEPTAAPTPATNGVAVRQTVSHLSALPELPADYVPVFGDQWPTHVARPATRRGGSASKKKPV